MCACMIYPHEHCLCPSACAPPCAHVHVALCMDAPAYGTTARKMHVHAGVGVQLFVSHANQCDPCPHPFPIKLRAPIMGVLASLPVLILAVNLVLFYCFFFLLSALPRWSSSYSDGGNGYSSFEMVFLFLGPRVVLELWVNAKWVDGDNSASTAMEKKAPP